MTEFKQFTASDGVAIEYADLGSGPVLFSPHPYLGSAEAQLPMLEQLSTDFRCITFSQRGWGGTPLEGEISLAQSARDARALLEHLGVDDAYWVALSMGVSVTWSYVEQFGCERMNRAFLMDMTPKLVNSDGFDAGLYQGWYTPERYEADLAQMDADHAEFNKVFFDEAFFPHTAAEERTFTAKKDYWGVYEQMMLEQGAPEGTPVEDFFQVDPAIQPTLREYWRAMGEADYRDVLGRMTVPVMLLYATPGSLYDERTAEYVRDAIPGARLDLLEDATHVTFLDPSVAVDRIRAFPREG